MNDTIKLMKEDLEVHVKNFSELKDRFKSIITDKNSSLEDRWGLFKTTPKEFKDHDSWILDLKAFESRGNFSWSDLFYIERYETVNLIDLVDEIEEMLEDPEEKYFAQKLKHMPGMLKPGGVDTLKEEILAKNLGSFKYDW